MFRPQVVLIFVVAFAAVAYSAIFDQSKIHTDDDEGVDRIFGGYLAAPGQFPWQASVRVNFSGQFLHNCGGSVITNRFIVTAGHCFPPSKTDVSRLLIVLGAYNRSRDGTEHAVENYFIHPGYNLSIIIHDIGLIQTVAEIQFTPLIMPVAVSRSFVDTSYRAVASGWGRTNVSAAWFIVAIWVFCCI